MNSQPPEPKEQNYRIVSQMISSGMNILQPRKENVEHSVNCFKWESRTRILKKRKIKTSINL